MINKYGRYFKFIVFAIPNKKEYKLFNNNITRPQKIYLEETALLRHYEKVNIEKNKIKEETLYELANQLNKVENNKIKLL